MRVKYEAPVDSKHDGFFFVIRDGKEIKIPAMRTAGGMVSSGTKINLGDEIVKDKKGIEIKTRRKQPTKGGRGFKYKTTATDGHKNIISVDSFYKSI